MTDLFLNFYVSNLNVLSVEMTRNQKLVEILNENIRTLNLEVQQKLKHLFAEMIKEQRLNEDTTEQNSQIKIIYLLMRQIQKSQAEKRSLTRKACDVLDKYLVSLKQQVQSATAYDLNSDNHGDELRKTLLSIKMKMNQPVQGNAVIIDLIKKIESGRAPNSIPSDMMILDDVNKNIELFSSVRNFNSLKKYAAITKEAVSNVSDPVHRVDNLQVFTDKIVDIGLDIKNRYKIGQPCNSGISTKSEEDYSEDDNSSTEEDAELCHCRKHNDAGEMVACDNKECEIKWYHFECVGLYKTPEGLWYCPNCLIFGNVRK